MSQLNTVSARKALTDWTNKLRECIKLNDTSHQRRSRERRVAYRRFELENQNRSSSSHYSDNDKEGKDHTIPIVESPDAKHPKQDKGGKTAISLSFDRDLGGRLQDN